MRTEALKRACEVAGGQKPLADLIGTTQSQVWYWLERSKKGVPGEFVLPIEKATGVPRSELRPDLYPPESSPPIAPASGTSPPLPLPAGGSHRPTLPAQAKALT